MIQFYAHSHFSDSNLEERKRELGANAMERVAPDAHFPTPWLFEPVNRPDDKADYSLDWFPLRFYVQVLYVFTLEWSGARPMGEQW